MSVDEKQLRAQPGGISDCSPLESYGQFGERGASYNASLASKTLYPCGLVAQSFFTDRFYNPRVCYSANNCTLLTGMNWEKDGIAWSSDLDIRFKERDLSSSETNWNPRGFQMPPVNDEELVVWMRHSFLPRFSKLHRKINDFDFKKGDQFVINVANSFPTWRWNGEKRVLLSTSSFLGGKSPIGEIHLAVGILSLVVAIFFLVKTSTMAAADPLRTTEAASKK